jgi:hypothetical protein
MQKIPNILFLFVLSIGVAAGLYAWSIQGVAYYMSTTFVHSGYASGLSAVCLLLLMLSPASSNVMGRNVLRIALETFLLGGLMSFLGCLLVDADLMSRNENLFVALSAVVFSLLTARLMARVALFFLIVGFDCEQLSTFVKDFPSRAGLLHRLLHGGPCLPSIQFLKRARYLTDKKCRKALKSLRRNNEKRQGASSKSLVIHWRSELEIYSQYSKFIVKEKSALLPLVQRFDEVFATVLEVDQDAAAQVLEHFIDCIANLDLSIKQSNDWLAVDVFKNDHQVTGADWACVKDHTDKLLRDKDLDVVVATCWNILAFKFIRADVPHWAVSCLSKLDKVPGLRAHDMLVAAASKNVNAAIGKILDERDGRRLKKVEDESLDESGACNAVDYKKFGTRSKEINKTNPWWDVGAGPGLIMLSFGLIGAIGAFAWSEDNVIGVPHPMLNDIHRDSEYNANEITAADASGNKGTLYVVDAERKLFTIDTESYEIDGPNTSLSAPVGRVSKIDVTDADDLLAAQIDYAGHTQLEARWKTGEWSTIVPFSRVDWFTEESVLDVFMLDSLWLFATTQGIVAYQPVSKILTGFELDGGNKFSSFKWSEIGKGLGIINGEVYSVKSPKFVAKKQNVCGHKVESITHGGWALCEDGELFKIISGTRTVYGGKQFGVKNVFKDGVAKASQIANGIWSIMDNEDGDKVVAFRPFGNNYWLKSKPYRDLLLSPTPLLSEDGSQFRIALKKGGYADFIVNDDEMETKTSGYFKERILAWDAHGGNFVVSSTNSNDMKKLRKAHWSADLSSTGNESLAIRRQNVKVNGAAYSRIIAGKKDNEVFMIAPNGKTYVYDFAYGGVKSESFSLVGEGVVVKTVIFDRAEEGYFLVLDTEGNLWRKKYESEEPSILLNEKPVTPNFSLGVDRVIQVFDGVEFWTKSGDIYFWLAKEGWSLVKSEFEFASEPYYSQGSWYVLANDGRVAIRGKGGWLKAITDIAEVEQVIPAENQLVLNFKDNSWKIWKKGSLETISPKITTGADTIKFPVQAAIAFGKSDLLLADNFGVIHYDSKSTVWNRIVEIDVTNGEQHDWLTTIGEGKALLFSQSESTAFLLTTNSGSPKVAQTFAEVSKISLGPTGSVVCLYNNGAVIYDHGKKDVLQVADNDTTLKSYKSVVSFRGQPVFLEGGKVFMRETLGGNYELLKGPWGNTFVSKIVSNGTRLVVLDGSKTLWTYGRNASGKIADAVTGVLDVDGSFVYSLIDGSAFLLSASGNTVMVAGGRGDIKFKSLYAAIVNGDDITLATDAGLLFRGGDTKKLSLLAGDGARAKVNSFITINNRLFGFASDSLVEIGSTVEYIVKTSNEINVLKGPQGKVLLSGLEIGSISEISREGKVTPWIYGSVKTKLSSNVSIVIDASDGAFLIDDKGNVAKYTDANCQLNDVAKLPIKPRNHYFVSGRNYIVGLNNSGILNMLLVAIVGDEVTYKHVGPEAITYEIMYSGGLYIIGRDGSRWSLDEGESNFKSSINSSERYNDASVAGVLVRDGALHILNADGEYYTYSPSTANTTMLAKGIRELLPTNNGIAHLTSSEVVLKGDRYPADSNSCNAKQLLVEKGGQIKSVGHKSQSNVLASVSNSSFPGLNAQSSFSSRERELFVMDSSGDVYLYSIGTAAWRSWFDMQEESGWESLVTPKSGAYPIAAIKNGFLYHFKENQQYRIIDEPVIGDTSIFVITADQELLEITAGNVKRVKTWSSRNLNLVGGKLWRTGGDSLLVGPKGDSFLWDADSNELRRLNLPKQPFTVFDNPGARSSWLVFNDVAINSATLERHAIDIKTFIGHYNNSLYFHDAGNGSLLTIGANGETSFVVYADANERLSNADAVWLLARHEYLSLDAFGGWWRKSGSTPLDHWKRIDTTQARHYFSNKRTVRELWNDKTLPPTNRQPQLQSSSKPKETSAQVTTDGILLSGKWGNAMISHDLLGRIDVGNRQKVASSSQRPLEIMETITFNAKGKAYTWDMSLGRKFEEIVISVGGYNGGLAVQHKDRSWSSDGYAINSPDPRAGSPILEHNFKLGTFSRGSSGYYYGKLDGISFQLGALSKDSPFSSDIIREYYPIGTSSTCLVVDSLGYGWRWNGSTRVLLESKGALTNCVFSGYSDEGYPLVASAGQMFVVKDRTIDKFSGARIISKDYMMLSDSFSGISWSKTRLSKMEFNVELVNSSPRGCQFVGRGFDIDEADHLALDSRGNVSWGNKTGLGRSIKYGRVVETREAQADPSVDHNISVMGGRFFKGANENSFNHYLLGVDGNLYQSLRDPLGQLSLGVPYRADSDGKYLAYLADTAKGQVVVKKSYSGGFTEVIPVSSFVQLREAKVSLSAQKGLYVATSANVWKAGDKGLHPVMASEYPDIHEPKTQIKLSSSPSWSFEQGLLALFGTPLDFDGSASSFKIDNWAIPASEETVRMLDGRMMHKVANRWLEMRPSAKSGFSVSIVPPEAPPNLVEFDNLSLVFDESNLAPVVVQDVSGNKTSSSFRIGGGKLSFNKIIDVHVANGGVVALSSAGVVNASPNKFEYIALGDNAPSEFLWRYSTGSKPLALRLNDYFMLGAKVFPADKDDVSTWQQSAKTRSGEHLGLKWSYSGDSMQFRTESSTLLAVNKYGFVADQHSFVSPHDASYSIDIRNSLWKDHGTIGKKELLGGGYRESKYYQTFDADKGRGLVVESMMPPISFYENTDISFPSAATVASEKINNSFLTPTLFFNAVRQSGQSVELRHQSVSGEAYWVKLLPSGFAFESIIDIEPTSAPGYYWSLCSDGISLFTNSNEIIAYAPSADNASSSLSRSAQGTILSAPEGQYKLSYNKDAGIILEQIKEKVNDVLSRGEFTIKSSPLFGTVEYIRWHNPADGLMVNVPLILKSGAFDVHSYDSVWLVGDSKEYLLVGDKIQIARDAEVYGLVNIRLIDRHKGMLGKALDYSDDIQGLKFLSENGEAWWTMDEDRTSIVKSDNKYSEDGIVSESLDGNWRWINGANNTPMKLWMKQHLSSANSKFVEVNADGGGLSVDYVESIASSSGSLFAGTRAGLDVKVVGDSVFSHLSVHGKQPERVVMLPSNLGLLYKDPAAKDWYLYDIESNYKNSSKVTASYASSSNYLIAQSNNVSLFGNASGLLMQRKDTSGNTVDLSPSEIIQDGRMSFDIVRDFVASPGGVYVLTNTTYEKFANSSDSGQLLKKTAASDYLRLVDGLPRLLSEADPAPSDELQDSSLGVVINRTRGRMLIDSKEVNLPENHLEVFLLGDKVWSVTLSGVHHSSLRGKWLPDLIAH